jgi:predicted RNA-binding protein YlqC (UPF0109 family)
LLFSLKEANSVSTVTEFVEYLAKAVVDDHDAVMVRELEGSKTTVIELSVAPDELGRLIGKKGQVVNAMRTLLTAVAFKEGKYATLELIEAQSMKRPPIVNADTIADLIQQGRITREGTPNQKPATCRTCGIPIPPGEGRRWYTLSYRYLFLCSKCDDQWSAELQD